MWGGIETEGGSLKLINTEHATMDDPKLRTTCVYVEKDGASTAYVAQIIRSA